MFEPSDFAPPRARRVLVRPMSMIWRRTTWAAFAALLIALSAGMVFAGAAMATTIISENVNSLSQVTLQVPNAKAKKLVSVERTSGFGVSPNGKEIVYSPSTLYGAATGGGLYIYNLTTKKTTTVTTPAEQGISWSEVRFAPSGEQIIGVAEDGIYSINTDGSHLRHLAPFGEWPAMSTDGYLAFQRKAGNELYIVSPVSSIEETGKVRRIEVGNIEYNPNYLESPHPSFIPGTHTLIYPTTTGVRYYNAQTGAELTGHPKIKTDSLVAENASTAYSCIDDPEATLYGYNLSSEAQTIYNLNCFDVRIPEGSNKSAIPPGMEPTDDQLIEEFRPIIKYDFEEPYRAIYPSAGTNSVGWAPFTEQEEAEGKHDQVEYTNLLKRGSTVLGDPLYSENPEGDGYTPKGYFQLSLKDLGADYPAPVSETTGAAAESEDYIDEHDGTEERDADRFTDSRETAEALGHVVHTPTGDWVQYWFYYYYNIGQGGVDDHEGDWEMVQIFLTKNSGFLRDKMDFSQHEHGNSCARGEYQTEGEGPGFGGEPVVYSAYGSHASYPREGYWQTEVEGVDDKAIYHSEQEQPTQVSVYDLPDPLGLYPSWVYWPGKWGGSEKSPPGPYFHSQWSEAAAWDEEAYGCSYHYVDENDAVGAGDQGAAAQTYSLSRKQARVSLRLSLREPQIRDHHLSVIVDASGLGSGVHRITVSALPLRTNAPPQSRSLNHFSGHKRIYLPVPIKGHEPQKLSAGAYVDGSPVTAKPVIVR